LDRSLDDLERAIIYRNLLEKQLESSWKKLSKILTALARRWDKAGHASYSRLLTKHTGLQKTLSKAQAACTVARQDFHDMRDEYDAARNMLSSRVSEISTDLDQLQRCHGALDRTLNHVVGRLKSNVVTDSGRPAFDVRDGAYDYIPYGVPGFLTLLVRLDQFLADDADYAAEGQSYRPVSFLEIGCGPGRNLMIARASNLIDFDRVAGFDINPVQVALGQQAFGLTDELQVADAMTFDYSAWDVVYTFRPFSDLRMQQDLEAHIAQSMRKSAYLLAPFSLHLSLYRDLTPMGVSTDIWKKTGDTIPPPLQTPK